MNIIPIPAFDDNYIWLLVHEQMAVCVDPGEAAPVLAYLHEHQLHLHSILITHHHRDHIGGVAALQDAYPDALVYGPEGIAGVSVAVAEGAQLALLDGLATVWEVPGHTHNHIAYLMQMSESEICHVFCGDTLFSAGCGRVFCGTIEQLHHSLQRFQSLPETTWFYPAHEYTANNIRFALSVEPDNAALQKALDAALAHTPTVPVTLAHEKTINPFLRLNSPSIQQQIKALNLAADDDLNVFAALRQLKNQF